jgi:hypothetical protein
VESRADFCDGDKWFVVRISPYTQGDRQVTGTVLTFTNVTAFRSSIDRAIHERECTKAILNAVAEPLVVLRKLIGDVYGGSERWPGSHVCILYSLQAQELGLCRNPRQGDSSVGPNSMTQV